MFQIRLNFLKHDKLDLFEHAFLTSCFSHESNKNNNEKVFILRYHFFGGFRFV
jgi:hypothetical protein